MSTLGWICLIVYIVGIIPVILGLMRWNAIESRKKGEEPKFEGMELFAGIIWPLLPVLFIVVALIFLIHDGLAKLATRGLNNGR